MPTSSPDNELTSEERAQARAEGWDIHGGIFRRIPDRHGRHKFFTLRYVIAHCQQRALKGSALHRKAVAFSAWTEAHSMIAQRNGWRLNRHHTEVVVMHDYLFFGDSAAASTTAAEEITRRAETDPLAALAVRTIAITRLTRN